MKYGLLRCFPAGGYNQSGNECLAECRADNLEQACEALQPACPIALDDRGYAKLGVITYVVGEFFGTQNEPRLLEIKD
jgi:hypothetical protein